MRRTDPPADTPRALEHWSTSHIVILTGLNIPTIPRGGRRDCVFTPPSARSSAYGGQTGGVRRPRAPMPEGGCTGARCSSGCLATPQAPRRLVATPRAAPRNPKRRRLRNRPFRPCHLNQKHFRICLRIHGSSSRMGFSTSVSRKYPHQPRMYRLHSSRSWLLVPVDRKQNASRVVSFKGFLLQTPRQ